jgi:hypothetical protein
VVSGQQFYGVQPESPSSFWGLHLAINRGKVACMRPLLALALLTTVAPNPADAMVVSPPICRPSVPPPAVAKLRPAIRDWRRCTERDEVISYLAVRTPKRALRHACSYSVTEFGRAHPPTMSHFLASLTPGEVCRPLPASFSLAGTRGLVAFDPRVRPSSVLQIQSLVRTRRNWDPERISLVRSWFFGAYRLYVAAELERSVQVHSIFGYLILGRVNHWVV